MGEKYPMDAEMKAAIDEQLSVFRETDGRQASSVSVPGRPDAPVLLLTTTGRKSGMARTTPLIFCRDGERLLLVASLGGYDRHPQWYLNLVEHPEVEVQVGADQIRMRAAPAGPDERERLWRVVTEVYPTYARYQDETVREIPVVTLDRLV
jgi:deazaflavin-dependent oxidoreductase (nitroreductase family)